MIRGVPGLPALIVFATFNNFLGGVFMALIDAYGLSLVSVEVWGLLLRRAQHRLHRRRARHLPTRARAATRCGRCCWSTCVIWTVCTRLHRCSSSILLLTVGMFV